MGFNISGKKKFGAKPTGPPEPVTIQPSRTQVVKLGVPYNTPRSSEIRGTVNVKVVTEKGERMYFFNPGDESWSNVSLKSTSSNPILSAPPIEAVEKAFSVLSRCPAVSKVSIVDEHGNPMTMEQVRIARRLLCALSFCPHTCSTCLTRAQVKAMDFIPLEEQATAEEEEDEDEDPVADAVVELQEITAKQAADIESLNTDLGASNAKQARLEAEIQQLSEKHADMQSMLNYLTSSVKEVHEAMWPASSAEEQDAPADAPADEPAAEPAPAPVLVVNRLQRAAAKKRRLEATTAAAGTSGVAATVDVTHDSEDDTPLTTKASRRRVSTKAK